GAGARDHVNWLREIIDEIAALESLTCRTATVYSDVSRDFVIGKMDSGKLKPMGKLEATEQTIRESNNIVAQLSIEPVIAALDEGADIIICGRLCDTAIYAAPAIRAGYDPGLAFHMAKIMECGSMCCEPLSASDVLMGEIDETGFTLTPMNPIRRCTVSRVAAHSMYEQGNPYYIYEPDGVIDLRSSSFKQIDKSRVRVSGSKLHPAAQKTLKLEGTRLEGYRTISFAGINDRDTIRHLDEILAGVKEFAAANLSEIATDDYTIQLRRYGVTNGDIENGCEGNVGIILDVVGKTEEISSAVCAVSRSKMLHYDYAGRKSTAGNLAFPFSPSDIKMDAVYAFSLYHLCEVDDPLECAQLVYEGYKNGKKTH
ncbi:MAG: acyclic terpene utilization AtuA family protein, partial [Spirochaetales bacterium]|nr:acyclic terpene utilization AtuA family protein [Spirochaetales bacterium]